MHRNAFGRKSDGADYSEWGGVAGVSYYLTFKVIGMGDLNAVDIELVERNLLECRQHVIVVLCLAADKILCEGNAWALLIWFRHR